MGGKGPGTEEWGGWRERGGQRSGEGGKSYISRVCVGVMGILQVGVPIRFGTYNIHNSRNGSLELELVGVP